MKWEQLNFFFLFFFLEIKGQIMTRTLSVWSLVLEKPQQQHQRLGSRAEYQTLGLIIC